MKFEQHNIETAPEAVRGELEAAQQAYGNIPNLYRGFATNPATLKIYLSFNEMLNRYGTLSPIEQQVVYLSTSAENGCTYCVAAHSMIAGMAKMPEQILTELREEGPLSDPKLNTLRNLTVSIVKNRGWVPEKDIAAFEKAGYDQQHYLEVVTIVAQKTISNYFNHVAETPLDEMFESGAWKK